MAEAPLYTTVPLPGSVTPCVALNARHSLAEHLEILAEVCSRFIFVHQDASRVSRLLFADSLETLTAHDPVATYLGRLAASRPAP